MKKYRAEIIEVYGQRGFAIKFLDGRIEHINRFFEDLSVGTRGYAYYIITPSTGLWHFQAYKNNKNKAKGESK